MDMFRMIEMHFFKNKDTVKRNQTRNTLNGFFFVDFYSLYPIIQNNINVI